MSTILGSMTAVLGMDVTALDAATKRMSTFHKMVVASAVDMNKALQTMVVELQAVRKELGVLNATLAGGGGLSGSMDKTAKSVVSNFDKIQNKTRQVAQTFRSFGWLATMTVTLPIITGVKKAIDAFSEFEYSMHKIIGLAGIAKSTTEEWGKSIGDMAGRVGTKPTELADALYFVASSGFKTAEALGIVEVAAKGSATGLGEVKTVADLVTTVMNAYGQGNITAARTMDILTAAVREGKGEADAMAKSLGSVIPFAAQLGISFDQVAGATAAMTLSGASAANAATYLRNIFMKLLHPAKQSEDALRDMGTSTAELRKLMTDKGLMAGLLKIRRLSEQYGEEMMGKVLPNIRGMLAELMLTGKNFEYNARVMGLVTNSAGSLAKAYEAVYNTTKMRLQRATASMSDAWIALGSTLKDMLIPLIEKFAGFMNNLAKSFEGLNTSTQKGITWALGFAAALGPVSLVVSTLSWSLHGLLSVLKKLGQAVAWLAGMKGFKFLEVAARVGPVVAALWTVKKLYEVTIGYEKKVFDAAKANDALSKALIDVNGELKKMSSLTEVDYASMSAEQIAYSYTSAKKVVEQQKAYMRDLYGYAKMGKAEYEVMLELQAKGEKATNADKIRYNSLAQQYNMRVKIYDLIEKTRQEENLGFKGESIKTWNTGLAEIRNTWKGQVKDYKTWKEALADVSTFLGTSYSSSWKIAEDHLKKYNKQLQLSSDMYQALPDPSKLLKTIKPTTTVDMWASTSLATLRESLNAVDAYTEACKRLGIVGFDPLKEKLDLVTKMMEEFRERKKLDTEQFLILVNLLNLYTAATNKASEALKDLDKTQAGIVIRSKALGDAYNADKERLEAFKDTLNKVVDAAAEAGGLDKLFSLDNVGTDLLKEIPNLSSTIQRLITDSIPTGIWGEIIVDELTAKIRNAQKVLDSNEQKRGLELLQMEAEAFKTLASRVEVVDYQLQAARRSLREMLQNREKGTEFVSIESIQEQVKWINTLASEYTDLQSAQDIQQAWDMNEALKKTLYGAASGTKLLSSLIDALNKKLTDMSANAEGTTPKFKALALQMQQLTLLQDSVELLTDAFDTLFGAIIDGGQNMKQVLGGILKDVLKKLVSAITTALILQSVMKAFGVTTGTGQIGGLVGFFLNMFQNTKPQSKSEYVDSPLPLKQVKETIPHAAKGGVVPSGYPNDTYPAMLTSGETIIPLQKNINTPQGNIQGPMIGNAEDLMSLNTTLSQTVGWYKLAAQGAMAFGTALKVTEPMIKAQTTTLQTKIPTVGTPNKLLDSGLAPGPTMPTSGNNEFGKYFSSAMINTLMSQKQMNMQTGQKGGYGKAIVDSLFPVILSAILGPIGGGIGGLFKGLFGKGAQGGIVPSGYPNDSYPALLSSNEAVIPLDKLNKQSSYKFEPVVFEIAGDRLEGILRKRMKKTSTY